MTILKKLIQRRKQISEGMTVLLSAAPRKSSYKVKAVFPPQAKREPRTAQQQNYIVDDDFVVMVNSTEQRSLLQKQSRSASFDMSKDEKDLHIKAVAAGITTGAVGLVLGGPIAAAIIGFGTTFVAKADKNSPVGEAARSFGELAISATDKVKEIDAKHQISVHTAEKVKEIDTKFHITEKSSELFTKTAAGVNTVMHTTQNRVRHYNEKHGWTDRLMNVWKGFERTILLTEDDLEFTRQIQYLIMERQLEKEQEQLESEAKQLQYVVVQNENINHMPFTLVN